MLSVSWSVEDHSVNIQALKKGLIEHEAGDTGGIPRWKSSCPERLAEATRCFIAVRIELGPIAMTEENMFLVSTKTRRVKAAVQTGDTG